MALGSTITSQVTATHSMSFSLSSLNPITSYLSIVKNEGKQVAAYVKSDPTIQRTEARFTSASSKITAATDILQSRNLPALQVILGAYNMSGQSTQLGLLRQLLTSGSVIAKIPDQADRQHELSSLRSSNEQPHQHRPGFR